MNGFKTFFLSWIFPWIPKRLMSRGTGVLMRLRFPGVLAAFLVPVFAKIFKIRLDEAEFPASHYHSFDGFFTRRLKPGLRPVQGDFVHPVDGALTLQGEVKSGNLIQAKGWTYLLAEFLGDADLAQAYENGKFLTYYLCPADYHRIHAQTGGNLVSARHIPGLLWPVNDWSVNNVQRLFNLNERVVLNFESAQGKWSSVLVGATNVGHITVSLDPSIITNRWMWHRPTDRVYAPKIPVKAGDELGMFHLGSTVINIFDENFNFQLPGPMPVKMGEKL